MAWTIAAVILTPESTETTYMIKISWRCSRTGQTAMVLKTLRLRETLSASIVPILWLPYTSTLFVVGRINNF